jgi:hypothetical protein
VTSSLAATLMDRLGLTDEELCAVLDTDPLSIITDDLDHRPEVRILLDLTEEIDAAVLRRWLRTGPVDLLLRRDFGAFEDALADLRERGLVIRKRS